MASRAWDYTLYESTDGSKILKVMFSEGPYKIDVSRYFVVDALVLGPADESALGALAELVRRDYPDTGLPEIDRCDVSGTGEAT
ncbi:hypothetical protein [Mycolicibacterium sediminis]|uniref:Uncharacterized protein n=1 Tax=Mycolicibacterium sediminis TaxID=1286180 RepID=A0A7I7QQV4_9MYCO|nr:hypothetical protein [Mycolicibacterium sediminis]BBY28665.1 hypothetical protein MSEDJ_27610 [Mycolicibacterium sediminis]